MTSGDGLLGPVGTTIDRIRRVFYVYRDDVDRRAGALEISFATGAVRLYDAGPDGERLAVEDHAWVDPFEAPLDDVNREYVAQSGKWTSYDVSDEPPYDRLIGVRVDRIEPILGRDKITIGVCVGLNGHELRAVVGADELLVELR